MTRLVLLLLFLVPALAEAASCTAGTDCYCDCAKHTTGNYKNATCESKGIIGDATALLMCEDFEAPTLRQNTGFGGGAPYYGPPYDNTGDANHRGGNGYLQRTYGPGVDSNGWGSGEPPSPTYGSPCGYTSCGHKVWSVGDLWDANDYEPYWAFLADGEYTQEPNLVEPSNRSGGGSGAFDGTASKFSRVPTGSTAGVQGSGSWTKLTTFGITQAMAYAPNVVTSLLMNDMWKGNEWRSNPAEGGGDGLFLFGKNGWPSYSPFYQTLGAGPQANCNSILAGATQTTGTFSCDAAGTILYTANAAQYVQATNWALGAWGCVRGYFVNMGTTGASIEMWFTGPSGTEIKIIDISNMDLTNSHANSGGSPGYLAFIWNNYANANQGGGGGPSTETSGRYEDNIHIRAGSPVSCAQIGYGTGGAPSSPVNFRFISWALLGLAALLAGGVYAARTKGRSGGRGGRNGGVGLATCGQLRDAGSQAAAGE